MSHFWVSQNFVYLSLCNPQSEKSCDIPFIYVKLPNLGYSQSPVRVIARTIQDVAVNLFFMNEDWQLEFTVKNLIKKSCYMYVTVTYFK